MFIFDFFNMLFTERALKDFVKEYEENDYKDSQEEIFTHKTPNFSSTKHTKINNKIQTPISQNNAFMLANQDQNLKTDFCKNDNRNISYLNFNDYNIKKITYNDEPYWKIEITKGDISWIEEDSFCDGFFGNDDLEKLQCLININTGKYLYFPKK